MGLVKRVPRLMMHEWFGDELAREFTKGKLVGRGHSRVVFENPMNEKSVVKLEIRGFAGTNYAEFAVWTYLQDFGCGQYLAPCVEIANGGSVMLQLRTTPVTMEELPTRIPSFLTDLKLTNWGKLPDGRVVCHDYASAFPILIQRGATNRMKRARWLDA